jgi:predicted esterase
MRTFFVAVAVTLAAGDSGAAQEPARFAQFEIRTYRDGEKSLPYRLLIPKAYKPGDAAPLIVWLHGSGEVGNNNTTQLRGIENTVLSDPAKCPAFVLAPQCPQGSSWLAVGYNKPAPMPEPSRLLIGAIAEVRKEFGLDDRRIYLGGFSMGSCGTWDILSRCPDLFAAAFPIAGPPGDREALAPAIKNVPIWAFHGERDGTAPVAGTRSIVLQLKAAGAEVKYTEYVGVGHECRRMLAEPELLPWLLAHRRASPPNFAITEVPTSAALIVKTLPDGRRGTWTGMVERTGRGAARLVIDEVRYRLKAAADADLSVAPLLASIGKGETRGSFRVTGTIELSDYAWLRVETAQQAD